jgi:hypothetical protein
MTPSLNLDLTPASDFFLSRAPTDFTTVLARNNADGDSQ